MAKGDKFFEALRRKYSSVGQVARALGIDEATLEEGDMPSFCEQLSKLLEQSGELDGATIEDALAMLQAKCRDPDEFGEVIEGFADGTGMGGVDRRHRAGDRRRLGRDEPEPFNGRPRPGGGMDPIRNAFVEREEERAADRRARGRDARRHLAAHDARLASDAAMKPAHRSFEDFYGSHAAGLVNGGGLPVKFGY